MGVAVGGRRIGGRRDDRRPGGSTAAARRGRDVAADGILEKVISFRRAADTSAELDRAKPSANHWPQRLFELLPGPIQQALGRFRRQRQNTGDFAIRPVLTLQFQRQPLPSGEPG